MGFMELFTTQEDFVRWENRFGEADAMPLDSIVRGDDIEEIKAAIEANMLTPRQCPAQEIEIIRDKWWARYSAPGYMDCTGWIGPCDSEEEAIEECKEVYGDEEESDEEGASRG